MSLLLSNGSVVLSDGGLAVSSQTSATVTLTRTGSTHTVGEAIRFEATGVTGLDTSETSFVMSDAALDQLVEWEWTITPPGGAATTWAAPTRLVSGHNARMKYYGRWGFIIPDVAGTWTFEVRGVDRNGSIVPASNTITVKTWASVVPDADVWVLHESGDSLAGAGTADVDYDSTRTYTTWASLVTALEAVATSDPIRVKVKGGGSWTLDSRLDVSGRAWSALIMHGYGTGKGTLTGSTVTAFDGSSGAARDLIVQDLAIIGPFSASDHTNPTSFSAFSLNDFQSGGPVSWNIYNCEISGWNYGVFGDASEVTVYAEDCYIHDWQSAALWIDASKIHGRGLRMEQPEDQAQGGVSGFSEAFGAIRGGVGILDGCTVFSNTGNAFFRGSDPNKWPDLQPAIRVGVATSASGSGRTNIQRGVFTAEIRVQSADGLNFNVGPTNCLIERNTMLGHFWGGQIQCYPSGVTIRNNMILGGSADRSPNAQPYTGVLGDSDISGGSAINTDPVRVLSNTVVDQGDQSGKLITEALFTEAFSTQTISNNTSYAPNYAVAVQPDGALTPQAGVSVYASGARMNFTHHAVQLASDLTPGNSSAEIAWWTLFDGYDAGANGATFKTRVDTSPTEHGVLVGSTRYTAADGLTFTTTSTGVTLNSASGTGPTISAGVWIYIQLDLRNDPPGIIPGTASVANDGRLWSVSATPDNAALVPYFDFFGNTRSSGSPTKGAIDPNGT